MEKTVQSNSGAEMQIWPLRESLLENILRAISRAEQVEADLQEGFSENLYKQLWADADLRTKILDSRGHSLIRLRQIVASVPEKAKRPLLEFLNDLLQGCCRIN